MDHETERASRVRVLRREPERAHDEAPAPVTRHLTHPITDLYDEITNDKASWTDATFWFVLGLLADFGKDALLLWWRG